MQIVEKYLESRQQNTKARSAFKNVCLSVFKKLFDDSNSEVREQALKLIGKLNKFKDFFTNEELNMLTAGLNE